MNQTQIISVTLFLCAVACGLCVWIGVLFARGSKVQRDCWHHDRPGWADGKVGDSTSWVREEIIDAGRQKRYWCEEAVGGCGKMWFL